MEINHISNSFINVKVNESVITCDPWVGNTTCNAWLAYPLYNNQKSILNKIKPNFIYISHLHGDHLHLPTLSKYKKKNTIVIIKKFNNSRLKNEIEKSGLTKIIELDAWKKYKLNKDLSVCIIPQLSSNTDEIEEQINYDLDTSILIQSNKTGKVFFNNVDNPLSIKDLKKIKKHSKKIFNSEIDITCFGVGAASEYPHCFTNINREKEKKKIIQNSLKKLKQKLNVLKPKVFFPAGGSYLIYGKFSNLNKFIAQPTFRQIRDQLDTQKYKVFKMEGESKIKEKNNEWILSKKIEKNNFIYEEKKINDIYKKKPYFFSKDFKNISIKNIDAQFKKSKINYFEILKKFPIKTKWKINFFIYKNLILNAKGKIDHKKSKYLKEYSLLNQTENKQKKNSFSNLSCHVDYNLFYGLLKRKYVWNTALSGSVVMFERKPNFFDPNVTFSLNFLGSH